MADYSFPTLNFTNPLSPLQPAGTNLNKVETQTGIGSQTPYNVYNVSPNQIGGALSNYQNFANSFRNTNPNLGRASLNMGFVGPDYYNNQLNNGIDYFGQLGLSEGLQNIGLQNQTANNQLAQSLSRIPGMEGVLGVLQNQNLFRSQLAGNPLYSQAQKDTAQRVMDRVNLQNQLVQLMNQTQLQQKGFNQQAMLAELQARLAAGQPAQNLLEILSGLQGQQRGVQTTQDQILAKNFK